MAETASSKSINAALGIDYRLDEYRITSVLGQGGSGITYKAFDETLQREVAIKEYLPQHFAPADRTTAWHPRARATRRCSGGA
jgi:non-specific serine/threonine protein kinase